MQPPTHSPLTPTAAHGRRLRSERTHYYVSLGFSCRSACSPGSERNTRCYAAPFLGHAEEFHCAKNLQPSTPGPAPVTPRPCRPPGRERRAGPVCGCTGLSVSHFTTCIYGLPAPPPRPLAHSFLLSGCVRLPIHLLKRRLSCACVPAFIKEADRNTCVQVSMWT